MATWTLLLNLVLAAPITAESEVGSVKAALAIEAEVVPITDAMRATWNEVIEQACASVGSWRRSHGERWDRRKAEAVLRSIDTTLVRLGFLYPDSGAVDLIAHTLQPFEMPLERRSVFEAQRHNSRRRDTIAERFPGPFYNLDCDTACFLYLAVAERLDLPLRLVLVPSHNRQAGHAFIRWREGRRALNWETNDGRIATDEEYVREWGIQRREIRSGAALTDLTADQTAACVHHRVAIQYERCRDFEAALRHLVIARRLFPQNLDVRRQIAWLAATTPGQTQWTPSQALEDARYVVGLSDDADARDTLAAALATAGRFEEAASQERKAIRSSGDAKAARQGYRERLRLYEQRRPYRVAATTPSP